MAYRKSIKGDENEQNEQLSHNRITIEGGNSAMLIVAFLCVLVAVSILFMALAHQALLEALIIISFLAAFVCAWVIGGALTWRQFSRAKTAVAVDEVLRAHARIEASVVHATENYILWRDNDGSYQFRGSTVITENRQFLPHTIAAPGHEQTILELYDKGMSGRGIEKLLKDKKVSYREIVKALDLYRPGWNAKGIIDSDLTDSE